MVMNSSRSMRGRGSLQGRGSPPASSQLDFDQILGLFTHRHTAKLYPRQAAGVQKVNRNCISGLRLPYLPPIRKILQHVTNHLLGRNCDPEVFLEPVIQLISLHGAAFDLDKDYDEFDHAESLSESITSLANAMEVQIPAVTIAVAEAISSFVKWNKPAQFPSQKSPTHASMTQGSPGSASRVVNAKGDPNFSFERSGQVGGSLGTEVVDFTGCPPDILRFYVIAHSKVISSLLQALEANLGEGDVALALIKLLRELSYNPVCAQQLVTAGYFNLVPKLLTGDSRSPIVDVAIELIWNLIELDQSACLMFGTEINVQAMSEVLNHQLRECYRSQDKELRNEVLVILAKVAKEESNRKHLARTSCLRTILRHGTFSELYDPSSTTGKLALGAQGVRDFTQTTEALDLEMKVLMWDIITTCATEYFSHAQIVQEQFLPVLLMYIDNDLYQSYPAIARWPYTQLLQLQMHALQCIIRVAPLIPTQFSQERGMERLIQFAADVAENPDNLVEKQLARHRTIKLQNLALQALVQTMSKLDIASIDHDANLISNLIDIFGTDRPNLMTNAFAITILSVMIKDNETNRRTFRKEGGLKTIAAFLGDAKLILTSAKQYPQLLCAVVDCVWSAVLHNKRNALYFLSLDGVDHLLNLILVTKDVKTRKQVLGCLADLLENQKALAYFHEWRCPSELPNPFDPSKSRRKAAHALSIFHELWSQEQSRIEEGKEGCDLRHSIHAVLSRVGFATFPYATPKEATCLQAIASFVASRRLSVFDNILSGLGEQGVDLVETDVAYLAQRAASSNSIVEEAAKLQAAELAKLDAADQQMLGTYYKKIEERKTQNTTPIPAHINTHSTMGKRMAAKEMKEDMLKNSLDVQATLRRTAAKSKISNAGTATEVLKPTEVDELEQDLAKQGL